MVFSAKYSQVPTAESFDVEKDEQLYSSSLRIILSSKMPSKNLLAPAFVLSLLLNILGTALFLRKAHQITCSEQSLYAGLSRNVSRPLTLHGPYDSENETATDEAWEKISIDAGNVALEDSYVKAMGLPKAQRFPWDPSKGMYILHGYHNLHCLKQIRKSWRKYRAGEPQSEPWQHVSHCFEALRDDIICNADDMPRYSGFQPSASTGLMQVRQCRDWQQLEAWAKDHTACYHRIRGQGPNFHLIEQYKFCPEGSPYAAKVAEVFG